MPLQRAEDQHAERGDDRPAKLHRAHFANGKEFHRLDQSDRVDDDDRRQRGIRQQAQQRREQQHGRRRGARRDQRCLLRPTSRSADDRGLRGAATGRHRTEQRAAEIGRPGGDQLAIGIDGRIARAGKGATRRNRFGEAHQRDPERARHQLLDQRKIRHRERRESLRDQADRRDPQCLQAEEPRRGDAAADGDQRRRRMRQESLHADQHEQRRGGDRKRQ